MRTRVTYLSEAVNDLDLIEQYIAKDNPAIAIKVINKILTTVRSLEEYPLMGGAVSKKIISAFDFRRVIIENYIVFYRVEANEVIIYRILHAKRDCGSILKYLV